MSDSLRHLLEEYHGYYEVSPYYVMAKLKEGSSATTRIQAGFDVDVYGVSNKPGFEMPPPPEYHIGYAELKKVADTIAQNAIGCEIETIAFPQTVFPDPHKAYRSQAVVRIRISHLGAMQEPAGLPEQRALQELEKQLHALGITRR